MSLWNNFNRTLALLLVFVSSGLSDENCTPQKLTEVVLETMEAKFWIKPESDFEMIEIKMKVNNILTGESPYYHPKPLTIESNTIMDSGYNLEPYWIPLSITVVVQEVGSFGMEGLVLRAHVNETRTLKLDDNLLCSQYKYESYKILAIGGLSFSRCKPSHFMTTGAPAMPSTTSDSSLSDDGNTIKTGKEDKNVEIITPANSQKKDLDSLMTIIVIIIVILAILFIATVIYIEWRNKAMIREREYPNYLSQLPIPIKGQDNVYFPSPVGRTGGTVACVSPPPQYSPSDPKKDVF